MGRFAGSTRAVAAHVAAGVAVGLVVLHPITMAIYWFEFHPETQGMKAFLEIVAFRVAHAFSTPMMAMSGVFALFGGCVGLGWGLYHRALASRQRIITSLGRELGRNIDSVIEAGESERVEFKASLRWDVRQGKVNKAIEESVLKTIAGFLNHQGGSLLIGVDDGSRVIGLEHDYMSLKRKNRDGFEQLLMRIVNTRLGGDVCPMVHAVFHRVGSSEICRVVVEPSSRPVYAQDGERARYYLRTGNATRELDVREAVRYIAERRAGRSRAVYDVRRRLGRWLKRPLGC